MANIDQDLQAIMQARYGREVRGSIHDAIRDINIESTNAKEVAITSRDSALVNANKAEAEATLAESYTKGGTGTREGEDTDNAEYYKTQTEHLSQGFEVIDSLESTNPYHPLSARQGNVLDGKISTINGKVGSANGIASLDSTGRIPYSQLPESAMEYKGTWNANTNTPTLVSGEGNNGDFYVVSVAGTWNNIDWAVGDRVLFDDVTAHEWVRLPAGEVQSVNGKVGAVELEAEDIPFDKGSSPLTSNDTNSAILEVLQKAGVQIISTTMADYLAHKVDYDRSGAIINITDTGVANSAGNVSYDNTVSELLSTTAQGAIDEVKAITDELNSNLIKYKYLETTVTLQSSDATSDSIAPYSKSFSVSGVSGFPTNPVCLLPLQAFINSGLATALLQANPQSNTSMVISGKITGTYTVRFGVLYID